MTDFIDLATDVWPFALILGAGVPFLTSDLTTTRAVLDAVLPAYRKRVLLDLADAIHRGPTFPIPPSVISALLREKAEETP